MPLHLLSPEMIASLIYLAIVIVAVIAWIFFSSTKSAAPAGPVVQRALIWLAVFVATVASYGLWQDASRAMMPRQAVFAEGTSVAIPRDADGHYYLTLQINDVPVVFVVDTGATDMVLGPRDAARIGLRARDMAFDGHASTANGVVATARVTLARVTLGTTTEQNVPAVVTGAPLHTSLLGLRYLSRWDSVVIGGDRMVLLR